MNCEHKHGYDYNEYLISLLQYAQVDNELSIAPEQCTFEHYKDVRNAYNKKDFSQYSKEYISLIGYMASYGGRFYDGGYGRDSKGGRSIYHERLSNFRSQAPNLKGIEFACRSYNSLNPDDYSNCLFYLDAPYKDTKKYAKQSIDFDEYYRFCRKLSENNIVLISEYYMPDDFECIWQKERKVLQKSDRISGESATEKLFIWRG